MIKSKITRIEEEKFNIKRALYNEIYKRVERDILECVKHNLNYCIFRIPEQLYGHKRVDISEMLPWIISSLRKEKFKVSSLNGIYINTGYRFNNTIGTIYDILIAWESYKPNYRITSNIDLGDPDDILPDSILNL